MKVTGIVRKIDDLGRYVIPKEYCKQLGIEKGDELDATIQDGKIVLEPVLFKCIYCGKQQDRAKKFRDGVPLCPTCITHIRHMDYLDGRV